MFVDDVKKHTQGTRISFFIDIMSQRKAKNIFDEYSDDDFDFTKTKVMVKLSRSGNNLVSRSEAKRILFGLEKFETALNLQGVDNLGLDEIDRKVLKVILDTYHGGPVGIESLAATLNEESDTIVDVVEPYLLKIGLLKRGPRGRQATRYAYEHLGLQYNKAQQKELFKKDGK